LVSGQQDYTQLPVSWDGKCNGLQHLSIAVRDERTASLVSLVPCDKPSDIYTEVVKATEALIPPDNRWKGQITRSLVKRPTMTTPYNVTTMGMGDQIKETLISEGEENYATKETNLAAVELRDYVSSGIRGLLGLTMDLMTWYSEVARAFTKAGTTLYWDLPDGFRVIQDIPKTKTKKLKLRGQTVVINYRVNLDSQDTRRNMSAFSPNITHSLDATHMSLWLSKLPEEVPVMAIHDSFGLPAPHMVTYGPEILKTFVELYRGFSPVAELQRVAADNDIQIPEAPKSGGLSLDSQVALATYAFA
jgi:DNA-directed RNA polymerase